GGKTSWRAPHEARSGVFTPRECGMREDGGSAKHGTIRNLLLATISYDMLIKDLQAYSETAKRL
ncbi:MAG: hypothetical protein IJL98_01400, partial [Lachnospiraceae bacterium]|nr:hypothetical protein [Lachnospiraceae bacterium]